MAGGKGSSQKLKLAERREIAVELRKSGMTYRDIAEAIRGEMSRAGTKNPRYDHTRAYRDVQHVLNDIEERTNDKAIELRRLTMMRLEELFSSVWHDALDGHPEKFRQVLQVIAMQIKLYGLDKIDAEAVSLLMLQQNNVTQNVGTNPFELMSPDALEHVVANLMLQMQNVVGLNDDEIEKLLGGFSSSTSLPAGDGDWGQEG